MKLSNAIFCEDIRQEINGKLSLIGLFSRQILLNAAPNVEIKWPMPIRIALFLHFELESKDVHPDGYELEYFVNEKKIIRQEVPLNFEINKSSFNIVSRGEGFPLELGNIGFVIKLFKGKKLLFSAEHKQALKVLLNK